MRCSQKYCYEHLEGDYLEILRRGYGSCPKGHITTLPGQTQHDYDCDCGARKTQQPGHSWFCTANKNKKG